MKVPADPNRTPSQPGVNGDGQRLSDRYETTSVLGRGGVGEVVCAWDRQLSRTVAIKHLHTQGIREETVRAAWGEAVRLASVRHPSIVAVYDMGIDDGAPYIVMEHVNGQTLEDRVKERPLDIAEFARVASQALEGLIAAHAAGLIHRDLKPTNLMLAPLADGSFQVKILDFGISKFISAPPRQTVALDGTVFGSLQCIAPEQLLGADVDARSDLYSLGCTLYFALTGIGPFGGKTTAEVIASHLEHRLVPIEDLRSDLPPLLAQWVMALINREPKDRYSSAAEALAALRSVVSGPIPAAVAAPSSSPADPQPQPAGGGTNGGSRPPGAKSADRTESGGTGGGMTVLASTLAAALVCLLTIWFVTTRMARQDAPSPTAVSPATPAVTTSEPAPPPHTTVPVQPAAPAPAEVRAPTSVAAVVPSPTPAPTVPAVRTLFRMHGSNTVGASLGPALAESFLRSEGARSVERIPGANSEESEIRAVLPDNSGWVSIGIAAHGTGTAFTSLARGAAEIGMASRPITDKEVAACESAGLGNLRSPASEHVVGLDGLAVFVHPDNPIRSLSVAQVKAIFSGRIRDWSELGGRPGPIALHARDDKSGTYDSFKSMVLGSDKLSESARRYENSKLLSDSVASDPLAIGFAGLPYIRQSRALALVASEGSTALLPSEFTVATEDYALSRRLYLYRSPRHESPVIRRFLDYVQSPEGQEVVRAVGFVPQALALERPALPASAPQEYLKEVEGAERISLNFRFVSGGADLDVKARRDLERLMRLLAGPEARGRELLLIGFSDSTGSPEANRRLSKQRAERVAEELGLRGVRADKILGFGAELPVADNETEQGRERNRRVEIWLR